jgi:hypothetical protein
MDLMRLKRKQGLTFISVLKLAEDLNSKEKEMIFGQLE